MDQAPQKILEASLVKSTADSSIAGMFLCGSRSK